MKLELNCEIGKDVEIKELEENFDSIYLAIGATKGRKSGLEGENSSNVYLAIDFLKPIQKRNLEASNKKIIDVKDKKVVVIGGGDTAMDCVRTSVREGAKSVKCLYRRDEANMPGSRKEVVNSKEEGVEFVFNVSPTKMLTKDNQAYGVELEKTQLIQDNEGGRAKVEIIENSAYIEDADIIVLALGFTCEEPTFLDELNISRDKWGCVETKAFKTSNPKVYSGGDCQRGADLAVTAAADGRDAAKLMLKELLK